MKKIENIYLNSENKLVLVDEVGRHYMVDHHDFVDPRFEEISEGNIYYEEEEN